MNGTTQANASAMKTLPSGNGAAKHGAEPIQIERDVPFPNRPAPYTSRRAKYPFAQMQIGDSFATPSAGVASAAKKYRDRMAALGEVVVLVVRKQDDGCYRVWRRHPDEAPLPRQRSRKTRHGRGKTRAAAPASVSA
jgi:hypothetical protein